MHTAIVGGRVIDGTGSTPIDGGTVLIEGERIVNVGPSSAVQVPDEAERISAEGLYVMPGFVDCHNHLGFISGRDESHQAADPPFAHAVRAVSNARAHLRDGVTTLRELGEVNYLDVFMRDAIAAGDVAGPRLLASGPFLTPSHGHGAFPGIPTADGVDQVRQAVRRNIKAGADVIKIMVSGGVSTAGSDMRACYFRREEIQAAIDEAHDMGRRVAAHLHGGPGLRHAVEAGIDSIEHGFYLTETDLKLMADHDVPLVLGPLAGLFSGRNPLHPEFVAEKMAAARESAIGVFETAYRLGVRLGCGADTRHTNHAVAFEAECLVRCGASTMDALRMLTRSGAEICGVVDQVGTLEAGKLADVVVVGADPVADIRALRDVRMVMKAGRVFNLSAE